MHKLVTRLMRVALVVLLLGSVLAQLLVPLTANAEALAAPELTFLVVPYSIAAILFIVCGQVALLVVWRLLSLVDSGVIFTRRSLRLVDVITVCGAVATVLSAGVLIHLVVFIGAGLPPVLWLVAIVAAGVAFVLLMIVMRGLLESAIADRAELDGVI